MKTISLLLSCCCLSLTKQAGPAIATREAALGEAAHLAGQKLRIDR